MPRLSKLNVSNPKLWVVIGVGVAGVLILAEVHRRRRLRVREDFGAFIERFELLPFHQPPPPAARLPLSGLTFAINDKSFCSIDVKGYVTGFGSLEWKRTHEAAGITAMVVTALLKAGATCIGKTVMDELGLGFTGKNAHYGTPTNPKLPSHIPGGASSGSAVAVASKLVDFALGTDTTGCIRLPASFCGVIGFRPSHGIVSTIGVLPLSQSLDTIGWLSHDPSILHKVGHVLLQLSPSEPKRMGRFLIADDLFQLSKVPSQKTIDIVKRSTEKLSGYHTPLHINLGKYIATNVPSLKGFSEEPTRQQQGISTLQAISTVMFQLLSYEFKTNYEGWINEVKPKFVSDVADCVTAAITSIPKNIKLLYKIRTELRAALDSLLKDDGILVIPTVADPPSKLLSKEGLSTEVRDRAFTLLSIASLSGCCQAAIPFGEHEKYPVSVSFIASHRSDKFLLDTILDMFSSLQEEVSEVSKALPLPDDSADDSELLKEKGNAAYKGKQWDKAISYYTEAIKLNEMNATFYSNRAAAYLELGCMKKPGLRETTRKDSINHSKTSRCLSFTASRDWYYRYFFAFSGLRSITTDFGDGTKMHCWVPKVQKPDKPNLLLIHGFGANAMWQYGDILRHFIPRFNVYVPDLLFFGGSSTTRPERTEEFQARCVKRLMEAHGVEEMSLVGISYGGFVGYSLAAQFPRAVERVVLCCAGVCVEQKDMENGLFQVADLDEAASILMPQTPDKLRELMRFSFVKPIKVIPSYFLTDFIDVMCSDYIIEKTQLIHTILEDRHFCNLPKIKQRTLIIWGDQDQIFPLELGYRLQRHIGEEADLVVIKNAGHAVNLEKTNEFVKHLKAFLYESLSD
nr:outer envelope protein 64, mitochondrial-like isoform X1 [Ipomoea trifida]